MNQVQIQENKTLDKARLITASKHVRRTSNRKIWIVGSQTTKGKFYRVMFDEENDTFTCDCLYYVYTGEFCKHVYACAIFEGSNA